DRQARHDDRAGAPLLRARARREGHAARRSADGRRRAVDRGALLVRRVAVVYHSVSGRTRALAEAVARGAASVEGTQTSVFSVDKVDQAVLMEADAIVFGCPTYMGS